MTITVTLNGKRITDDVAPDLLLYDWLRQKGCLSVKCGCETTNCGLCTVHVDGKPTLSCAMLAVRADKKTVTTLEGLQEEAIEFGGFMADEGAEQCGFCNPGFIMNVLAMKEEPDVYTWTDRQIKEYLEGNLCRCTGYAGHLRAIRRYLAARQEGMK